MNILPTGFEPVISTVRGWRHNRTRLRERSAKARQSRNSSEPRQGINLPMLGIEPRTYSLEGCRSIQLSYMSVTKKLHTSSDCK